VSVNTRNIATEGVLDRLDRGKKYGVYVGIVTDNKDPEGGYRVRVRIPSQANGDAGGENSESTFWYRVGTFGAGNDRGEYNLPENGDEVLLAFENGEMSHGYVITTLWNGKSNKSIGNNSDGKNHVRWYKSRSGHVFKFCDDPDKKSVLLQTKTGHTILLDDDEEKKIKIEHASKKTRIELFDEDIKVYSKGDTIFDCQNFKVTARTNIELTSSSDTKITASANIKGQASANVEFNASGMGKFTASGTITIKGAMVNIN
jgi:uncharacterized protein involved in type VI secretion and phage assembly